MRFDKSKTCCFIGHRKINETDRLKSYLYSIIEDLIVNKGICSFLFGSRSEFDSLCLWTVTQLKEKYPHILRIYVRAEYPYIDEDYRSYLLNSYDDTYYPEHIKNSGKAAYIERNYELINNSDYCICYYNKNYLPPKRRSRLHNLPDHQPKSGTEIAYLHAIERCGNVINLYEFFFT